MLSCYCSLCELSSGRGVRHLFKPAWHPPCTYIYGVLVPLYRDRNVVVLSSVLGGPPPGDAHSLEQASRDLTLAAASGHTSDAVRAIGAGAEIDVTVNSYTPLMRASTSGHVGTVTALVAEGADMFATDRLARTALDWARIARRDKVARFLERAMENEICYRR